jgi:hypothetical protein
MPDCWENSDAKVSQIVCCSGSVTEIYILVGSGSGIVVCVVAGSMEIGASSVETGFVGRLYRSSPRHNATHQQDISTFFIRYPFLICIFCKIIPQNEKLDNKCRKNS